MTAIPNVELRRTDSGATTASLRAAVLRGLRSQPKTLPAALFYDARGAALFEEITSLPEYYLTRTEHGILQQHAQALAGYIGPNAAIIEFGSGAAIKVRYLLSALNEASAYVPVDVSREQLHHVAAERAVEFPEVPILPVWADYNEPFDLPDLPDSARRIGFFPGSTIGNLHPDEAIAFLRRVRDTVGGDGGLVLGVDRRKHPKLLHAAYNDTAGVTAEFNLNALSHLNREMQATFTRSAFRHHAFFNDAQSRIEMHLEAISPQHVTVLGQSVQFAAGERILTECSYKYNRPLLERVVSEGGFRIAELFTDAKQWFWVAWLEANDAY
jgi:dimethylhistidine N-methyltransferase